MSVNKGKKTFNEIIELSSQKALRGGLAGSSAMVLQVTSLMWLRTTMNYQYRYGTSLFETIGKLYKEGGVRRFYRGIGLKWSIVAQTTIQQQTKTENAISYSQKSPIKQPLLR